MGFIQGDRGYPPIRFEYKTPRERYLVAEIYAEKFWVFLKNANFHLFSKINEIVYLIS